MEIKKGLLLCTKIFTQISIYYIRFLIYHHSCHLYLKEQLNFDELLLKWVQ